MAQLTDGQPPADDGQALLSCEGLTRHFGALAAVDGLSFSVRSGELFGIAGPNGAGKTTLFNLLSGHVPLSAGVVHLDGEAINGRPAHVICQRGLARTFQTPLLFETGTVDENLLLAAYFGRSRARMRLRLDAATREQADRWLAFCGLEARRGTPASELSVFEKKRLMLAAALATSPRLLLLDEPVGGLNHQEMDEFVALLQQVRAQGVTIVLIEHVMKVLMALSDRVMIMHQGRRLALDVPEAISRNQQVIDVYLGQAPEAA